jgi:Protein of unknown function (DUF1186)/PBS lyase HEAT-like repeat
MRYALDTEVPMSEFDEAPLDYEPPVAELLEIGDDGLRWDSFDYLEDFELSAGDVPELLRMAADERLNTAASASLRVWAPIHAIRALAQLRAAEAVEPLLNLIVRDRDDAIALYDDWLHPEVSKALVEIGSPAAAAVVRVMVDQGKDQYSRAAAARVLSDLGRQDRDLYPHCVAALATSLENFGDNVPELNAFIIGSLIDLDAEETCPLIERAFTSGAVDETVVGDWEDAQVELGRLPPLTEAAKRQKTRRRFPEFKKLERLIDRWSKLISADLPGAGSFESTLADPDEANAVLDERPDLEKPSPMVMPEDLYTADERRRIAKKRNKQRKAAKHGKHRGLQAKHRH